MRKIHVTRPDAVLAPAQSGSCATVCLPDHDRIFSSADPAQVVAGMIAYVSGQSRKAERTNSRAEGMSTIRSTVNTLDVQRGAAPVVLPNRETG